MTNLQSGIEGIRQFSKDDAAHSNKAGLDFDLLTELGKDHSCGGVCAYLEAIYYDKYIRAMLKVSPKPTLA